MAEGKRREMSRLIGAASDYEVWADARNFSVNYGGRTVGHYRTLPTALRCIVDHAVRRGAEAPDLTTVAASVEKVVGDALIACVRIAEGAAKEMVPCSACDGYGWNRCSCGGAECSDREGCGVCGGVGMQVAASAVGGGQ